MILKTERATNFDGSKQDEHSFGELDVTQTEELAENNLGEPEEGVPIQFEPENRKRLEKAEKAGAKNWDGAEQDEPSFG